MKLKGDLDSLGVPELFKTLADQHATGILVISGPMGEKAIALQDGGISVFTDPLAERTRIGDLLVARGLLADTQLAEALKYQREAEPRARLGEVLVKKGFVDDDKIKECVRFQLEEELFDLFTWKGASFEFDSEKTIADLNARGGRGAVTSLGDVRGSFYDPEGLTAFAEPQALIAEAAQRLPEWKELQTRLPTPYLCFKLTPKAEENLFRGTRTTQAIMKLVKEGRTLETVIKRSCMGRFEVCRVIIKALDEGWLFPYPASELRMLASEHRVQRRFQDALNIYRRLLESTENEGERAQLQELINDTIDAIQRAKAAGEAPEGGEIVSHKAAAEQYFRRQRIRRVAFVAFCVVSFFAIVILLLQRYAPKPQLPEAYQKAIHESDTAVASGQYDKAMNVWQELYSAMPDKESDTAKRVLDRLKALPRKFDSYVETLLQPVEILERNGALDEAEAGYKRLLAEYPQSPLTIRMNEGLARITTRRETVEREALLARLNSRLQDAAKMQEEKRLSDFRKQLEDLRAEAPQDSELYKELDTRLRKLGDLEKRVLQLVAAGEALLQRNQGERALVAFEQALGDWPDLPALINTREAARRLKERLDQASAQAKRADTAEAQGDVIEAAQVLREIEKSFSEFQLAADLKPRITALEERAKFLQKQLTNAQTAFATDKVRGRELYAALIRHHPLYLVRQNVRVPVVIESSPRAKVELDGKEIGSTPIEVEFPVATTITLALQSAGYQRYERRLARLMAEDLEIHVRLKREPVRMLDLREAIFAPPRVIGGKLYVLHGTSLSAYDSTGEKRFWTLENLFDDSLQTRPSSTGSGPPEIVTERSWWYPRLGPEPLNENALLLPLRSRDVLEIDVRRPAFKKLLTLPTYPVGRPYLDRAALAAGKCVLIIASADGKLRRFDVGQGEKPLWERPLDPNAPAPKGGLASGVMPRPAGSVMTLSASGRLMCLSVVDGREQWNVDLKQGVSELSLLPSQDALAFIVKSNGALSAVDLNRHDKVWDVPAARASDEMLCVTADENHFFVFTREGVIRKYSRNREVEPTSVWQRPLDGAAELPLVYDKNLYAVTNFGTLYAVSPQTGDVIWDYRPERKPTQMSVCHPYVYLASEDGTVLILNAE